MTPEERDAAEAGPYFLMRDQRDTLIEACESLRHRIKSHGEFIAGADSVPTTGLLRVYALWTETLDAAIKQCPGAFPDDP